MLDLGADVLAFRRGPVTVVAQLRHRLRSTCPAGEVLMASGPVDGHPAGRHRRLAALSSA